MSISPEHDHMATHPGLLPIEDIGRQLLARAAYNGHSHQATDAQNWLSYHVSFDKTEARWTVTRDTRKPVSNILRVTTRRRFLDIALIKEFDVNSPYKPHRVNSARISITGTGSYYFRASGNNINDLENDRAHVFSPDDPASTQLIEGFRHKLVGFINIAEIMLDFPPGSNPIPNLGLE